MAGSPIPHFHNQQGHAAIEIGVKEFKCVGSKPPFDHPHIYLDMGEDDERVCPYCSTLYRYNATLAFSQTMPEGCAYVENAA
ncbi:zinc-finger domain-containing protein [Aquamicrobium segne]|uniref:Zinc-finger domain-containing protein n=1 Tax=Aquamicrobium segne TaxID=469547 RepID=A0ABW0H002_9HYPH